MLGYILEAKMPKEAWENLQKIFVANTTTRKLQLGQEFNNIQERDMSITSYTLKEDQGVLRLTRLDKRECGWWWWDGANMPRRPRTTVRRDAKHHSSKG